MRACHTFQFWSMLAYLANKFRDGIPVALAAGIVKQLEVASSFRGMGMWLRAGTTRQQLEVRRKERKRLLGSYTHDIRRLICARGPIIASPPAWIICEIALLECVYQEETSNMAVRPLKSTRKMWRDAVQRLRGRGFGRKVGRPPFWEETTVTMMSQSRPPKSSWSNWKAREQLSNWSALPAPGTGCFAGVSINVE